MSSERNRDLLAITYSHDIHSLAKVRETVLEYSRYGMDSALETPGWTFNANTRPEVA